MKTAVATKKLSHLDDHIMSINGELMPHIHASESHTDEKALYSRFSSEQTVDILSDVSQIYADLDGTCLPMGATSFPKSFLDKFQLLSKNGCKITFITGKPLSEVQALVANVPLGTPLEIVFEKGAYILRRDEKGNVNIQNLLAPVDIEQKLVSLKNRFEAVKTMVEKEYGVIIWPAGDGNHKSVLSIDIIDSRLKDSENKCRAEIKVKNQDLLHRVRGIFVSWLADSDVKGWEMVDLGNANFEINYRGIDKGHVLKFLEQGKSKDGNVLLLGDSGNDLSMFNVKVQGIDAGTAFSDASSDEAVQPRLRRPFYNGAIQHDSTPDILTNASDFVVKGEARADLILQKIIEAKGLVQHLFVVSNTPPLERKGDKIEIRVGMPVALADFMATLDSAHSQWIYVGDDEYPDHCLSGKLVSTPITEEERQAHYVQISNETLWPLAHKPETKVEVMKFGDKKWNLYKQVCDKVAQKIAGRVENYYAKDAETLERPTIWVQDYQMLGVAESLKNLCPSENYHLGLYWHIPFPEPGILIHELGKAKARKVIGWLSAYNVVGFHTQEYALNYLRVCEQLNIIPAKVVIKPISVNVEDIENSTRTILENGYQFEEASLNDFFEVTNLQNETRRRTEFVLCGMERGDDTKACVERLEAWKALALKSPELFVDKKILEVIVPSRPDILYYRELYERVQFLIQEINQILGREVIVHKSKLGRKDAIAAMVYSDTVVVTAKKDGFNMSAAEAAVVQKTKRSQRNLKEGKLVISDKIGFYQSLNDQRLQEAVHVIHATEQGITAEVIAQTLQNVFTGNAQLPENHFEMLDRYFDVNTLQEWARENIRRIVRIGASDNIQSLRKA